MAAAPATAPFDHLSTGFELTGAHRDTRCESCHVDGVFKATPTVCSACHATGTRISATGKPATHILSTDRCAACHTTSGFRPVVSFDHGEVRGSCASCHNNVQAVGKPPGHIVTNAGCDSCHSTTAWTPVKRFDHTGITGGCAACHNGVAATGKSATHLPTTGGCENCHNTTAWSPARFDHAGITTRLLQLPQRHHGNRQEQRPISSPPTAASRATPYRRGSRWPAWITPRCRAPAPPATTAAIATGKPTTHIPTTAGCDSCHSTTTWKTAKFDHTGVVSGCSGCHNGTTATGKNATHMTTTLTCEACHSTTAWRPVVRVDHAQVLGTCACLP